MSEPITTYTRSNGTVVPIKEMNDHHLLAAIKKMKRDGYISAADKALFEMDPGPTADGASDAFERERRYVEAAPVSDILTALEAEQKDRGLHD